MRYGADHKKKSKERILEAGRQLFRQRGFEGASIDEVMNAASLTRGAFYAHFTSKDDLVRQVLDIEAGLVTTLRSAAVTDRPRQGAIEALSNYLDPGQRADVAIGCPLQAHPVDAIRGDDERKSGYTDRLRGLIDSIGVILGDDSTDEAIVVSVLAVGGGLLSAAVNDGDLADHIEAVCLDRIGSLVA